MKINSPVKFIGSILVCELAGIIGTIFTSRSIERWYATLIKPQLSPPNWVFGPVWVTLYGFMGISLFLIWKKGLEFKQVRAALVAFVFQLALNSLWSILFFGLQNPGLAFVEIIMLWCQL